MIGLFDTFLYQPIFNLLIGIYNFIPGNDIGVAIIILTILVKTALWPVSARALKSQKSLQDIQPKLEELKKKYPDKEDKEKLAKEMMELYSKEKVNPMASCLPLLIQLPVFIALYKSLIKGLESQGFDHLYSFVANPGTIEPIFLGLVQLGEVNIYLAVLAAITQYFQAKMMVTKQQPKKTPGAQDEKMLANMNKSMVYMMPVITLVIGLQFPGGLTLYWLVMNLLTIFQQKVFLKKDDKEKPAEATA
ncbi:MAG: YidC/Oxa1 family membrane protein insertase [Patescibacteria group bacterium]|nr:YidC/Oxa1 family membrane protein insertase [Patescibacteria group bacterium]